MVTVQQRDLNILIVEDDEDTAEVVCTLLEDAGFNTESVGQGELALNEITSNAPDLVLLDIDLPDINGIEVLRSVRSHSFLPMIILSGYGQDRDRVVALEAGADDYMSKPFSPEELVARVRALLRRVEWTPKPETQLQVRDLELDMPRRQAMIRSRRLHLTPIEYGILVMLMRSAGQVVTHDELLRSVWGEQYRGDFSVLRVNISRLRQKLEDNPRRPSYIVTAPGQGYWMPLNR
ncbi:response regulator transcription factor [Phototrophicus methaneseepsis]|uniref:Response regulator transcription factor n=1 Tax=Phototrophicus methaneseepsis TaxID=2710758 RepID=A0A7S8IE71_9CHLR|nr:response regulator transcription factor [Phototrophicus methaneseepsis]QPC81538.1 response regulator transcription factor [Phototrophicus methaneseepsis]